MCEQFEKFLFEYIKQKPNIRHLYVVKKGKQILHNHKIARALRVWRKGGKSFLLKDYVGWEIYWIVLGGGKGCKCDHLNFIYIGKIKKDGTLKTEDS